MGKKKPLAYAIGTAIIGAAALAYGTAAVAQENEELVEEVIVTGSRIAKSPLETATPLQMLSTEDIALAAETNIGDFLNQMPAMGQPLFNRSNSNFDINNSGVLNINLRDLGISRTLTLVNGRRFVAGVPGSSAVDLNAIPSAMVERVEISTGGSSAVYGSDAVAGVVNFILKDDFEGVELSSRYEVTDEDDGKERDFGLLMGSNFSEGKGNVTMYVGYTDQGAVYSRNRERTKVDSVATYQSTLELRRASAGQTIFQQSAPFFSSFPPQGRFDVMGTGAVGDDYTFLPDGTLVDSFVTNGNDTRAPDGFNRSAFRTIAIPTERFLAAINTHYDFNDNVSVFVESTYSSVETVAELEPHPFRSTKLFRGTTQTNGLPLRYENSDGVLISNPYIPAAMLAAADATAAAMAADGDPDTVYDGIFFTRRLVEFGPRKASNERQTFRVSTGLDVDFENSWSAGFNYTYGQTTQAQVSEGNVDVGAMRHALLSEVDPDNPGQIRCVDANARRNGCVPINIFGAGTATPAAIAYVAADKTRNAEIVQRVLQLNAAGELFEMPSGPFSVALGYERREEESSAVNDPLTVRGLNSGNAAPNVVGEFEVDEFYVEVDVPILSDQYVDYFGFSSAARQSDYSTVGNTTTYEGSFNLRFNEEWLLRTSAARAVRAPGIDELFDPGTQTFAQVADPCSGATATSTGAGHDNCRTIPAIAQRIANTGAFTLTQPELQGTTGFLGGNPNLFEETANTVTFGFVHTPTYLPEWMDGFVSVDYWDIEVEDAIATISQNNVLKLCYESADFPNHPLCRNIVRHASGTLSQGALEQVNSGSANVAEIVTRGIDVAVDIDIDLDNLGWGIPGSLSFNTAYTRLNEYNVVNLPGQAPDNAKGEIGNAKHKWNTNIRYRWEDLTLQWQVRYIGDSRIDDTTLNDQVCLSYFCNTGEVVYSDIQVRYMLPGALGGANLEIFGGVENAFDEPPPIVDAGFAQSDTGTGTVAGVYDAIGRSWYMGIKASF